MMWMLLDVMESGQLDMNKLQIGPTAAEEEFEYGTNWICDE